MFKILLLSTLLLASPQQAAHVHGSAQVSLGFEGNKGKIVLEIPGDSLFGFEHEAKSKKDKAAKEAALTKLDDKISEMIVFNKELECVLKKEFFEVNQSKGHSDVSAEFSVNCQKPVAGSTVSFNFQKHFSRLKKVKVDVIADTVQKSLQVTKNGDELELK